MGSIPGLLYDNLLPSLTTAPAFSNKSSKPLYGSIPVSYGILICTLSNGFAKRVFITLHADRIPRISVILLPASSSLSFSFRIATTIDEAYINPCPPLILSSGSNISCEAYV